MFPDILNQPLTTDGLPLVTSLADFVSTELWTGARVNPHHFAAFSLHPLFPLVAVFLYLLSEPLFNALRNMLNVQRDSPFFKLFILLHNLALAGFSLWIAVLTWPIMYGHLMQPNGFQTLHCEPTVWTSVDNGIATWASIFYLSKFYEFIDTWVLVFKNSDGKHAPSFLQKYHHFGIALTMWAGVASASNWLMWVICLNATIHTMMYTYYALATVGYRSPLASILTNLQMLQFLCGILFSSSIFMYKECASASPASKASLLSIQVYAAYLIYLFNEMAKKKYKAKKMKSKGQ